MSQQQQTAEKAPPRQPNGKPLEPGQQDLSGFKFDDNTFFLVIDEGDEDGRLTTHVLSALPNVNPARIMSGVPLLRLSERHSLALVVRPHVRGERKMLSWPIYIVGPLPCEPHFEANPDAIDQHGLCAALSKAMFTTCGRQMPATLKIRDEGGGKGDILRMRSA
jgi:hypothetical protein